MSGIRSLLQQEVVGFSPGLAVAGIDDAHLVPGEVAARQILPMMQGTTIVLSHRPAAAEHFSDRPGTLVLAGHTHGGQTIPMVFLVSLANGWFRAGFYDLGEADLYVSRGSGYWGPPMRLLSPPEVVLIEVVPGPAYRAEVIDPTASQDS